eukprot:c17607_g1_i2.p1 GENE.c17607_g1_i2~~c17607_g1_i2.p1  ORF type:complete len:294 (+),score=49.96 c17607_g1_i2:2-883(+)
MGYSRLLEYDQLLRERARGAVFAGFSENRIDFPPTFKCKRGLDIPESSSTPTMYSSQRVPSYCDRVLWHTQPAFKNLVEPQVYTSVQAVTSSDHKPVRAEFAVKVLPEPIRQSHPDNDQLLLSNVRVLRTKRSGTSDLEIGASDAAIEPALPINTVGPSPSFHKGLTLMMFSYPSHLITERVSRAGPIDPVISKLTSVVGDWGRKSFTLRLKTHSGNLDKMHVIFSVEDRDMTKTECVGCASLSLVEILAEPAARMRFSIPLLKDFVESGLVIEGNAYVVRPGEDGWVRPAFA